MLMNYLTTVCEDSCDNICPSAKNLAGQVLVGFIVDMASPRCKIWGAEWTRTLWERAFPVRQPN